MIEGVFKKRTFALRRCCGCDHQVHGERNNRYCTLHNDYCVNVGVCMEDHAINAPVIQKVRIPKFDVSDLQWQ